MGFEIVSEVEGNRWSPDYLSIPPLLGYLIEKGPLSLPIPLVSRSIYSGSILPGNGWRADAGST